MEKFGIFELLDALSAITAAQPPAQQQPRQDDAAYLPPVYGDAPQPPAQEPARQTDGALASFLARHEAIAKKAERDPK